MTTILKTIVQKGYLFKELPPHFNSHTFASYAVTKVGRKIITNYIPKNKFTQCIEYKLAQPGHNWRSLELPHPASFVNLCKIITSNFTLFLNQSGASNISRSKPIFHTKKKRAISTQYMPSSLSREKLSIRGTGSYLLIADINQFYPSLYTHSIGWAINPKLRQKEYWNSKLVGRKIDKAIMDLQGKKSQGIPIGSDISFLLAEIVLSKVDKALKLDKKTAFRWFDDYQFSCDSFGEAEKKLKTLTTELKKFNLRLNPIKTKILKLPFPILNDWKDELQQVGKHGNLNRAENALTFIDTSIRLRSKNIDSPIFQYALGFLFSIECPKFDTKEILVSSITQFVISEPGCAQKAFTLLDYWELNGLNYNHMYYSKIIHTIIKNHESIGASSDISWALAFAIKYKIKLSKESSQLLWTFTDDFILIQTLHMNSLGLLSIKINVNLINNLINTSGLDGEHWLLTYESYKHGFLQTAKKIVENNILFNELYIKGISFYKKEIPEYGLIIHNGGAPEWIVKKWMEDYTNKRLVNKLKVTRQFLKDLKAISTLNLTLDEMLNKLQSKNEEKLIANIEESDEYVS